MSHKIRLLIVDDEADFRDTLASELRHRRFNVITAANADHAMDMLHENDVDVVLLDIRMPKIDGIELLAQIKKINSDIEVIMLTGHGTVENAVEAMHAGASDFLTKPCRLAKVETTVRNVYEKKLLKQQNLLLKSELNRKTRYPDLIGNSQKLKEVLKIIDKVAPMDSTVLILGESGVGKELVAKSIHRHSTRAEQPFIVMDCCSLNENLLQSELFGHEKGAYTGAVSLKHGLFEVANGGTLFLDEIGEISLAIQAGLLRVLETGSFRRVGGVNDVQVDVRILAATNRDLVQAIRNGIFREDLFYRLNVVSINVPPLRERSSDIALLVDHALQTNRIPGSKQKKISPEAMDILCHYHWPGNIRELLNLIERAVILSDNEIIQPHDLPLPNLPQTRILDNFNDKLSLADLEMEYIKWTLNKTGGNQKQAAEILKIDPKTLYRKLKKKTSD